ncbi:hypothetical protein ASE35_11885 [Lysobacter sp. Root916]|uniref:DUF2271 domain-containing protein n=1 Tax=Lysobacter sp. Root916 TaxID=1736606 RepID=UPI00070C79C4|nr:DUF2271 domain-containing protein [Lysobacter sp. Root916]KRD34397.1 hypothetical protein ASE35_11885 [Lysobacter sp. Root916]
MKLLPRTALIVALAMPVSAFAADLGLSIEIPRLKVAEYHRPYVAAWIERPDNSVAADLAVWYDVDMKNGEGTKWLKDIRQWWRRSGRSLKMPVDGVSGATRAVGQHSLNFKGGSKPLAGLAPGQYTLVVEAAREVGGRELLSIPFQWPAKGGAQTLSAQGKTELGAVRLAVKP